MTLLVLALAVALLLILLLCWAVYQLIGRYGAMLIRLEALEATLARSGGGESGYHDDLPIGTVEADAGHAVGTVLQDFALPALQGGMMRLSQWRGRDVLLIFFDPACGFSRLLLPKLTTLRPDAEPLPVIISTGDREQNRRLFAEHHVTIPVLLQEADEVASLYAIPGTPAGYRVDAGGTVAAPLALGGEAVMALSGGAAPLVAAADPPPITRAASQSRLIRDGLRSGTPAPAFRLPGIDGEDHALSDFRGRRVLLVFSDPGCAPCMALAPDLERIHRERPDLAVLMVSRNGPEANRAKAAEQGVTFPIVLQRHWEISRQYGMFATPIAYLIDEEGIIAAEVAVGGEQIVALARANRPQAAAR